MSGISNYTLNQKINAVLGKTSGIPSVINLDTTLTTGNNAGANDIDMNGNDILNTASVSSSLYKINEDSDGVDGGLIKFQTKEDGGAITEKVRINNAGAIGIAPFFLYGGTNQVLESQGANLPPIWKNNFPDKLTSLPVSPNFGDQFLLNFSGSGNIGALMPMIYDGINWRVIGSTILCRWFCGSASQVINSTSITNIINGDYGTITFSPPITGYYEVGQTMFKWELNSGIGMSTYFSSTDGTENWRLYYVEDWNGSYTHWRSGVSCPIVVPLQSTKTYRFTANITYAFGNQGTLFTEGTAYVKAVSS